MNSQYLFLVGACMHTQACYSYTQTMSITTTVVPPFNETILKIEAISLCYSQLSLFIFGLIWIGCGVNGNPQLNQFSILYLLLLIIDAQLHAHYCQFLREKKHVDLLYNSFHCHFMECFSTTPVGLICIAITIITLILLKKPYCARFKIIRHVHYWHCNPHKHLLLHIYTGCSSHITSVFFFWNFYTIFCCKFCCCCYCKWKLQFLMNELVIRILALHIC